MKEGVYGELNQVQGCLAAGRGGIQGGTPLSAMSAVAARVLGAACVALFSPPGLRL